MIPMLQVSANAPVAERFSGDLDLLLEEGLPTGAASDALLALLAEAASRRYTPKLYASGMSSFQLSRGLLGLSM